MRKLKFILFIFILFTFYSCNISSNLYKANSINTPLFKGKKEFQMAILINDQTAKDQKAYSVDLQSAYSFQKNFGFMLNFQNIYQNKPEANYSVNDEFRFSYFEIAPGYFKNGIFEIYAGYGIGKTSFFSKNSIAEANFNKFFIQSTIGKNSKFIDFAFSVRASFFEFNKTNFKEKIGNEDVLRESDEFYWFGNKLEIDGKTYPFIEPALTLKLGYKQLKIVGQLGVSFCLKDIDFDYNKKTYFNLGIHINFSKNKDKNKIF